MMKMLALALLPVVTLGCRSANKAPPSAEHVASPAPAGHDDKDRKAEHKDDDDDDRGGVANKQVGTSPAPNPTPPQASGPARTLSFDTDQVGSTPGGFTFARTGQGAEGKWVVKAEPGAPSGANVLAQLDADNTDYRFPVAIADVPLLADLRLSVKCKQVSGKVDQGCGLIFRVTDPDNYYVTRANALEDNVRLYHVVKGKRVQFAGWNGKVKSGVWHDLRVDAKGDHFEVYFDGQ